MPPQQELAAAPPPPRRQASFGVIVGKKSSVAQSSQSSNSSRYRLWLMSVGMSFVVGRAAYRLSTFNNQALIPPPLTRKKTEVDDPLWYLLLPPVNDEETAAAAGEGGGGGGAGIAKKSKEKMAKAETSLTRGRSYAGVTPAVAGIRKRAGNNKMKRAATTAEDDGGGLSGDESTGTASSAPVTSRGGRQPLPLLERLHAESWHKKWRKPMKAILKVPLPIFVLNLPKSGTLTVDKYFDCGMGSFWSMHHWMRNASGYHCQLGQCMGRNVDAGRPIVDGCGGYAVYTDAGAIWEADEEDLRSGGFNQAAAAGTNTRCFYPGVHGLDNIAKYYPNSTIVHVKRNTSEWVQSASGWSNILARISSSCDGFPKFKSWQDPNDAPKAWSEFYERFSNNIRDFARQNPSLTYVEAELESPELGKVLEKATGIRASCLEHHHKTSDVRMREEAKAKADTAR